MNANFRQKLERKKNEKYEHEKIFEFGNAFSNIRKKYEYSNVRIFVPILTLKVPRIGHVRFHW